jgi:hypothetical protein
MCKLPPRLISWQIARPLLLVQCPTKGVWKPMAQAVMKMETAMAKMTLMVQAHL